MLYNDSFSLNSALGAKGASRFNSPFCGLSIPLLAFLAFFGSFFSYSFSSIRPFFLQVLLLSIDPPDSLPARSVTFFNLLFLPRNLHDFVKYLPGFCLVSPFCNFSCRCRLTKSKAENCSSSLELIQSSKGENERKVSIV